MNKLKHITLIVMAAGLICSFGSCRTGSHQAGDKTASGRETKEGFTKATVIYYEVDGCSWMLQLEDGKKLQPDVLPPAFKKADLQVWIKYSVKKNAVGICMAGEMVNLTEIELR